MQRQNSYGREEARRLDRKNPLSAFRERFYLPPGNIYLDGNSLGLLSTDAEESLMRVVDEWKTLGIGGWMNGKLPWFEMAEKIGSMAAGLVGAEQNEVIYSGTTTINIHTLTGTFYKPEGEKTKILADELNFPSDLYALQGQIRLRDLDPEEHLLLVKPDVDGLLNEESIIDQMNEDVALIFLPSVLYRSGQLLDIEKLAIAARERGIPIGFDCSHSAGVIPHEFSRWGVDFALWCSYKYLNAGPGAAAFYYVNKRHFNLLPSLPGWFGGRKEKQFDMLPSFMPAPDAGRWQISSPGILGSSPMEGAMKIILEAGIEEIRNESLRLTDFLAGSVNTRLNNLYPEFKIITPLESQRRGGHIAIQHPEAAIIYENLLSRGIITDLRPPNIIRMAPVPLYNTFEEIYHTVDSIQEIISSLHL
ncbi:MAG: kynureninase [bacterium]